MNKIRYYIFYTLVLYSFIFMASYIDYKIQENIQKYFNPLDYIIYYNLLDFLIGMFLGLSIFVKEIKKKGNIKLNLQKLIILSIPPLCVIIYFNLGYPIFFLDRISIYLSGYIIHILALVLGYVFITSFYKENKEKK